MDKWIVYVDEFEHAMQRLQPLLEKTDQRHPVQWLLVACPPRVTHYASKWVTKSARDSRRGKWADKLFARLVPLLEGAGDDVLTLIGSPNLVAQTESLISLHGAARVLDARRPKMGHALEPVNPSQTSQSPGTLGMLSAVAGTGWLAAID
jgi:hypothetical protein